MKSKLEMRTILLTLLLICSLTVSAQSIKIEQRSEAEYQSVLDTAKVDSGSIVTRYKYITPEREFTIYRSEKYYYYYTTKKNYVYKKYLPFYVIKED